MSLRQYPWSLQDRPGRDPVLSRSERKRRDVVFIRITLVAGRTDERKKDLYRRIVTNLETAGVRGEDVVISLTANNKIDWSIGKGVAQLVEP
ncbi:tautomerase family protein [Nocardia nova]|uniref:tautomerase family protein n=1 Tax=Nocardia nova TaxID=37330 RepID=UPI003721A5DC